MKGAEAQSYKVIIEEYQYKKLLSTIPTTIDSY